nr:CHASE3 domain-containing protein [uncultured Caldimonas sp.]
MAIIRHQPTKTWHVAALMLASLLAFAFVSWTSYRATQNVIAAQNERERAAEVLQLIEQTLGDIVDMETHHRGFLLTGNESFLVPYEEARQHVMQHYGQLSSRQDTRGQAGPDALHGELEALLAQRIEHLDRNIAMRRSSAFDPSIHQPRFGQGKALMDRLRATLGELGAQQARRVDGWDREIDAVQARARSRVIGMGLLGSLLLLWSVWLVSRERRRRDVAEARLQAMNGDLEAAVDARTREALQARDELAEFVSELDQSIEAERRRIAREVHDQCGQIVAAMQMLVERLRGMSDPKQRAGAYNQLLQLLAEATATARRIAAELRPPLLDDLGFSAAVEHHAQTLSQQSGLAIVVDVTDDERLTPLQTNQLFRILQEALVNVYRHARASRIAIEAGAQDDAYRLCITDDGIGPGEPRPGASGLRNMRERASLAGGVLEFGQSREGGAQVVVRLPLGGRRRLAA